MSSSQQVSSNRDIDYTGRLDEVLSSCSIGKIPVAELFFARYRAYPCTMIIEPLISGTQFHVPSIRQYLEQNLKHDSKRDVVKCKYHKITRSPYLTDFLADLTNGLMIDAENCQLIDRITLYNHQLKSDAPFNHFLVVEKIRIHFLPQHETFVNGSLVDQLVSFWAFQLQSRTIQIVDTNSDNKPSFSKVTIERPFIHDLDLHYGSEFMTTHNDIQNALSSSQNPTLILLHGPHGTGKTYYIRYLVHEFSRLKFLCIPSTRFHRIDFLELLNLINKDSSTVLIIDDAEDLEKNHIQKSMEKLIDVFRKTQRSIIAAFNSTLPSTSIPIHSIEILEHRFQKLDSIRAEILLKKLNSTQSLSAIDQPLLLGKIYGSSTENKYSKTSVPSTLLRTPDEMVRIVAEHELALSETKNCTVS